VTVVLASGCKETLPVYQEPPKVVECRLSDIAPSSINYGYVDSNNPVNIYLSSQSAQIILTATNVYDETIQDNALVTGQIEIQHATKPGIYRKISFSRGNLINNGQFDPYTGLLTIDPGKNVQIQVFWDYKDSSGTYVFLGLPIETETDYRNYFIRDHTPAPFIMKATIQLYSRLAPVRSSEFEMILHFVGRISYAP
jgi:hypothetical protein